LTDSRWDCIVRDQCLDMLLKVTGKVLLDHNTRYSSIHRIHGYCYCSIFLLLFTILITVHRVYDYYYCTVIVIITTSSQYSSNKNIDCLTELNNNINGQTYTGIGKSDGGDSVYILGEPRIQVAQPTEGSTAGFLGYD